MSTAHATARTPKPRKLLSARQLYRMLNDRRPAEDRWDERQQPAWDELAAAVGDRDRFHELQIAISDGEGEFFAMREECLLLAVGTICLANERPDIWRQIFDVWDEMHLEPNGEMTLLDELMDKRRRGEL